MLPANSARNSPTGFRCVREQKAGTASISSMCYNILRLQSVVSWLLGLLCSLIVSSRHIEGLQLNCQCRLTVNVQHEYQEATKAAT